MIKQNYEAAWSKFQQVCQSVRVVSCFEVTRVSRSTLLVTVWHLWQAIKVTNRLKEVPNRFLHVSKQAVTMTFPQILEDHQRQHMKRLIYHSVYFLKTFRLQCSVELLMHSRSNNFNKKQIFQIIYELIKGIAVDILWMSPCCQFNNTVCNFNLTEHHFGCNIIHGC